MVACPCHGVLAVDCNMSRKVWSEYAFVWHEVLFWEKSFFWFIHTYCAHSNSASMWTKELLKQMFHKPRWELCEKIAINGRGWLVATPGKLILEKSSKLHFCSLFFWLQSVRPAVVAFFLIPRSSVVLLFVKLAKFRVVLQCFLWLRRLNDRNTSSFPPLSLVTRQ
jgi:hypothetical protein